MSYLPAGFEDEYDSSDSDDFCMGGPFAQNAPMQGNGKHSTNGGGGGFRMGAQTKVQRDKQGSPLIIDDFKMAASRGNLEEVKEFIEKGMAVDCMLKAGWTALMYAASCGKAAIVKYLLETGADPNFNRASFMYSPLMAVCSSNLPEDSILEILILLTDHKANVNTHEKSHMTPLMVASQHGHARVVKKLLAHGAEVNYTDNRRWTALFYAAEKGHTRVVELLLANRADAAKCNNDGTAADVAYSKDFNKLGDLLAAAANPAKSYTANGTASPIRAMPVQLTNNGPAVPPVASTTATPTIPTKTTPSTNSISNHQPPSPSSSPSRQPASTPPPLPTSTVTSTPPATNAVETTLPPTNEATPPPITRVTSSTTPASTPSAATPPAATPSAAVSSPPVEAALSASHQESFHVLDDLELFFYGLKLSSLIQLFREHDVSFSHLLQMTEDDIEKVGVCQVGHRKKILDAIHGIHRKKWEPGSIRKASKNLSLKETHAILDNINKHLLYITSSIQYFQINLTSHNTLTDPSQEQGSLDLVSKVNSDLLTNTRLLHDKLREFRTLVNEASKSTDSVPADLIEDPDKQGMSAVKKTLMALTAVGVVVSIAWFKKPIWIGYFKTS